MHSTFEQIRIFPLGADDWSRLRDIRLRMLMHDPAAYGDTYEAASNQPDEFWIDRAGDSAKGDDRRTVVAADGDRLVGSASCFLEDEEQGGSYLVGMWVDPMFRGRRIGEELLKEVVEWSRSKASSGLRLHVNADQSAARRLYERFGFRYTGRSKPMDRDPSITLLEMSLDL